MEKIYITKDQSKKQTKNGNDENKRLNEDNLVVHED